MMYFFNLKGLKTHKKKKKQIKCVGLPKRG